MHQYRSIYRHGERETTKGGNENYGIAELVALAGLVHQINGVHDDINYIYRPFAEGKLQTSSVDLLKD